MKYRGSEIIVGAFVLAGLFVIIAGIFTIRGLGYGALDEYYARYTNAGGIEIGSPVKFNGVLRGRVQDITIDQADPTRVKVTFAVRGGTPVTTRTIAKITRADLLGDPYVDLRFADVRPGTAAGLVAHGEPLAPGTEVGGGDAFDMQATLDNAQRAIESLSDLALLMKGQLEAVIQAVQRLLGSAEDLLSDENRARLEATLVHIEDATSQMDGIMADNRQHIDSIVRNADRTTADLGALTRRLDAAVDEVLPRATNLLDETSTSLADVRRVLGSADGVLRGLDMQQVADLLSNMDTATRNLADLSRDLKDRPYRLLRPDKPNPPRFSGREPAEKSGATPSREHP